MEMASAWLLATGMSELKNISFLKLSQLQQRLVLIARAMIKHPPLLILDEPSSGLDDEAAGLVVALINKIAKESSTAIIYVSHRQEQGLDPDFIYQLNPGPTGSKGIQTAVDSS